MLLASVNQFTNVKYFLLNFLLSVRYSLSSASLRKSLDSGKTSTLCSVFTTMASSFVIGDQFRTRVTELLGKTDSSVPQSLREELEEIIKKPRPSTLPFTTARKLKKYLQEQSEVMRLHVYLQPLFILISFCII